MSLETVAENNSQLHVSIQLSVLAVKITIGRLKQNCLYIESVFAAAYDLLNPSINKSPERQSQAVGLRIRDTPLAPSNALQRSPSLLFECAII